MQKLPGRSPTKRRKSPDSAEFLNGASRAKGSGPRVRTLSRICVVSVAVSGGALDGLD